MPSFLPDDRPPHQPTFIEPQQRPVSVQHLRPELHLTLVPQQPPFLLPHRHPLRVLQRQPLLVPQQRSPQPLFRDDQQPPLLLAQQPSVLHLPRFSRSPLDSLSITANRKLASANSRRREGQAPTDAARRNLTVRSCLTLTLTRIASLLMQGQVRPHDDDSVALAFAARVCLDSARPAGILCP
jgi:hypothetical protein